MLETRALGGAGARAGLGGRVNVNVRVHLHARAQRARAGVWTRKQPCATLAANGVEKPTARQLRILALHAAIPMGECTRRGGKRR